MEARVVYTVVHKNDEWQVIESGANLCKGIFRNKVDAVELARELAMGQEVGELRISKLDGSIQSEQTFGSDPLRVEG